ncbi:MAG: ion channel [Myxococcaceae bacterium]
MPIRTRTTRVEGTSYDFTIIDDRPLDLRDISHAVLGLSWPATLGLLTLVYVVLNALFAVAFHLGGGVANLPDGSFRHAFFFSVQTMATIGYGAMYPQSDLAHVLVFVESVVGLVFTALATGLVFVRFSRVRGRVQFAKKVTIGRYDGTRWLTVRIGNGRSNRIFDAQFRMLLMRTVKREGEPVLYRSEPLLLARDVAPNLQRAWNLMHRIDETSPLWGATAESLLASEAEIHLAVAGTDETTLQTVHGRFVWEAPNIAFGVRPADVVSEQNGNVVLDLRHFDDVTAAPLP